MNLKALVTMLVLGSSSLALADHDRTEPAYSQPAYSQPAQSPPAYSQPTSAWHQPGSWWNHQRQERPVLLSNDMHLTGRALIEVGANLKPFTKLELRANNGRTSVDRVIVMFGNGRRQVLQTSGVVTGKSSLTIDLPGGERSIKSVMLIGSSRGRASIDVLAV